MQPNSLNSLAYKNPELVAQWHPLKNGSLTPADVTAGSGKKIWWICLKDSRHIWQAEIKNRSHGKGCPYCSNRRVNSTNNLEMLYPSVAKEWHSIKNGDLKPTDVSGGSHKIIWWLCPKGFDHEWEAAVNNRVAGKGCPYCTNQRITKTNNLEVKYPDIAKEWHPLKNRGLLPRNIHAGSNKKVWWKCPKGEDHVWETPISRRTQGGSSCPFCANRYVSTTNSLASVNPDLAKEWHPTKNIPLTPSKVIAGSHLKVWWKCPRDPQHEWAAVINSRNYGGYGCPYCSKHALSSSNSLATVRPDLAKEWHPTKNDLSTPSDVSVYSNQKVWWKCRSNNYHEWKAIISSRSRGNNCPLCRGWTIERIRLFVGSITLGVNRLSET